MLSIGQLDAIRHAANIPFVLHGGTGIQKQYVLQAIKHGIAKINIGMATRQPYETNISFSVKQAQKAVYDAAIKVIKDDLELEGTVKIINSIKNSG